MKRYLQPLLILLVPLAAWGATITGGTITGGSVNVVAVGSGTDFTVDAACIAAWDMGASDTTINDICDTGTDNVLTEAGTPTFVSGTSDGITGYYNIDANEHWYAPDDAEFDDIEGAKDFSACCMTQIPTGATRESFGMIINRNNADWFLNYLTTSAGFNVRRASDLAQTGTNTTDDIWYAACLTYTTSTDTLSVKTVDTGITVNSDVRSDPPTSTERITIGCSEQGINCNDQYIAACMVLDKEMTDTEVCQFAAYGPEGNNWDRSATVTCE